ncbi:hypothetical protein A2197_00820 [Candidatus Woesebacteria bacterium RIFOXYA1_FULL_48_16]|uniref:Uncharacterized protein n=1 Tax=Candidatus Woesebacteria bacterium RIFOXYA1_FULL_48_16 TaxID=1802535 RepID=A0A1F8CTE9_9BACT|nr:MAG: hypothetical protein A2197_00820 [Candidatus Woesebacteria bacterium RIFOXYA1_FULL_48_16]
MSQKSYYLTTGAVFLVIAILHLLRIVNGWPADIGGFVVPMWLSWVAVPLAGYLAYHGLKIKKVV